MNSEIKKQYGYLTVLEDTEKKYHSTKIYRCRCVYGKIIEVNIDKLHSGHVKSCGCRKFKWRNLTGQKFGRLTVVEFAYAKNRKSYWKCRCDCKNVCFVSTSQLATGETVSCGCKNDENRANIPHLDRGLVDGTMKCEIRADKKLNRNNTSCVRGIHFDRQRGLWMAQIMFQHKAYLLGRFKHKKDAINARKEEVFRKI